MVVSRGVNGLFSFIRLFLNPLFHQKVTFFFLEEVLPFLLDVFSLPPPENNREMPMGFSFLFDNVHWRGTRILKSKKIQRIFLYTFPQ